jgi:hypothetical protein
MATASKWLSFYIFYCMQNIQNFNPIYTFLKKCILLQMQLELPLVKNLKSKSQTLFSCIYGYVACFLSFYGKEKMQHGIEKTA